MNNRKPLLLLLFIVFAGLIAFFGIRYYVNNQSNVQKEGYFHIPTGAEYSQVLDSISPYLKNPESFERSARSLKLPERYYPGRYKVSEGKTNKELIEMIQNGNQVDVSFRIGDFNDVYQMMGRVAKKTELDSLSFIKEFDQIAKSKGLGNAEDLKKFFFIDTYNFFWTVKPKEFFGRFEEEYNKFWTQERRDKEKKVGLSRDQIYALASIVYQESGGKPDEMKTIAGLYLNRYHKGMKLQSDPTVIYAVNKDADFKLQIKRVYYRYLTHPSPYNTYAHPGIPPGPICVVDKNSVDAVLNPENHNYIFMAADPSRPGLHRFTASDSEHVRNARDYQNWLNKLESQR